MADVDEGWVSLAELAEGVSRSVPTVRKHMDSLKLWKEHARQKGRKWYVDPVAQAEVARSINPGGIEEGTARPNPSPVERELEALQARVGELEGKLADTEEELRDRRRRVDELTDELNESKDERIRLEKRLAAYQQFAAVVTDAGPWKRLTSMGRFERLLPAGDGEAKPRRETGLAHFLRRDR